MAAEPDTGGSGGTSRWDGYSDYKTISLRIANAISDALQAVAEIDSAHTEGAPVAPDEAARLRARIQYCALELIPEMEQDRKAVDAFDDILTRWEGGGSEDSLFDRLDGASFQTESPGWLTQIAIDLKRAGWELGYLQAGRTETEPDDPVEAEVDDMFEGL